MALLGLCVCVLTGLLARHRHRCLLHSSTSAATSARTTHTPMFRHHLLVWCLIATTASSTDYCWQAHITDYPQCGGYAGAGYTCVGDYCSAIDPGGTPARCANFVPRADAVDPLTGKCTGSSGPATLPACTASTCCNVAIPKLDPLTTTWINSSVCSEGT